LGGSWEIKAMRRWETKKRNCEATQYDWTEKTGDQENDQGVKTRKAVTGIWGAEKRKEGVWERRPPLSSNLTVGRGVGQTKF